MKKYVKLFRILTAFVCLIFLGALAWSCTDIYLDGTNDENQNEDAVIHSPIFTREIVVERLAKLLPLLLLLFGLILFTSFMQRNTSLEVKAVSRRSSDGGYSGGNTQESNSLSIQRTVLLVLAIALIVVGVVNGGARAAFIKAINICTECIGLG